MKASPQDKIAVLGAGPMGLAVAYQLCIDGYKPIIFESDDRIGGMTASFDFSGQLIERYYHFHCVSDVAFLEILAELGIAHKMHWVHTKMGYWYLNRLQEWGSPLSLLRFKGLSLTAKLRYGVHAFLSTKRNNWRPLDRINAVKWIKSWVGDEAYEVLWRRLFDYKFYQYADNLSAAWIWSRIRRIGRSRYDISREKLGYLEGGSETLLQAMRAKIESHGGIICLNSPVEKVIIENGSVKGLIVSGKFQPFARIISTIPLPYVKSIIPDLPQNILENFNAIKNIAVVCVVVKLKKKLTNNFWLNINDPLIDIPGIVEYTNLRPLSNHIAYVPFYMPHDNPRYQLSNQEYFDCVKKYFKKINPLLADFDFLDMHVSRYRHAQPICDVGFSVKLPPAKLPVTGLWVADTSYYYPEDRGISESIKFGRAMASQSIDD